ncbi:GNAT family N-acetyltransferase [Streptomyces sp. NPDC060194]|uniref:GNAT family N-acetyltransferase n=1 Tax=Streptomyces sp. NPDC060194 TaxID=3347069 RepID=UPI003656ABA8
MTDLGAGGAAIRPYHPSDLPGMYRICLLTGDVGRDATAKYRDPDVLGHLYLGPYPAADPALSFVVADEQGLLGYVVATADTAAFDAWLEEHWWPGLRLRYPAELAKDPGDGTDDWRTVSAFHRPHPSGGAPLDRYPAHLHIDILPRGQGAGLGRRLLATLFAALRERGVPGVQLGVGGANTDAQAFYRRIGFTEHGREEWGLRMVYDLSADDGRQGV